MYFNYDLWQPVTAMSFWKKKSFLLLLDFLGAGKFNKRYNLTNVMSSYVKRSVSRPCTERIISLCKASLLFFVVQINIIIIRNESCVFTYVHQIDICNTCEVQH